MAFLLLFSHGSPQTFFIVTTVSSLVWNHCSEIMIKKLLVLPFPASRVRSSLTMAGSIKTSPCQLGFLPQVCQLLTIYMCKIFLPGRALSKAATSPAWDTKTGPGRDCPTSSGPDSCRTNLEGNFCHWGRAPSLLGAVARRKKKAEPTSLSSPVYFSTPIYSAASSTPPG